MITAEKMHKQNADGAHATADQPILLLTILQALLQVGGALLAVTGLIASLCTLFLYHSAVSWFKQETIAIYLLQIIAGFAAVATAHYLNQHPASNPQNNTTEPDRMQQHHSP